MYVYYLPKGEGHGKNAKSSVWYGQRNYEYISGSPHPFPSQDSRHDEQIPAKSHDDGQNVND